ncbi:hypothetical protein O4G98_04630 [Zoogloeaceae bacterium G21618-S1]|nr:hypothetical protein [Zoogloeaceae bacterium G21618-S1]
MLRSGYLYLYNEALKRWSAWFVTEGGYFMPFEVQQCLAPGYLKGREPCSREGHREIASCITISSPKLATDVWLAFSDVQWTAAVLDRHNDAGYRARYMRKLNVPKLLAGQLPAGEPVKKIAELGSTVAEYASASVAKAFAFSPASWQARAAQTEQVIAAAESLNPGKGVIVALHDPAGIAMDLSALMKHLEQAFLDRDKRNYRKTINAYLNEIEAQIKEGAQRKRLFDAMDERDYRGGPMAPTLFPATRMAYHTSTSHALAEFDSAEQLEKVADAAWERYAKKLEQNRNASGKTEREAWQQAFIDQYARFDKNYIAPLADAHVAWMQSGIMASYADTHYDDKDIESGLSFVQIMVLCVAGTGDKRQCQELYTRWLNEAPGRKGNLLLEALVYKQSALSQQIIDVSNSVTWEQLPWDKLNSGFDTVVKGLKVGTPDVLGRLVACLAGSIASILGSAAQKPKVHAGLVAIGVASKKPVIRVEVTGGKKAFREALVRQILKAQGAQVRDYHAIHRAVAAEMRRMEVYGVPMRGVDTRHWLLMVDPEQVRGVPAGLSRQARAQWLAKSLRTPEQIEALDLQRLNDQIGNAETRIKAAAGYHAPMAFAVVGVIANAVAFSSVNDDLKGSMNHKYAEMYRRWYAQGAQLVGAIGEAIEAAIARGLIGNLNLLKGITLLTAAKFLKIGLGIGGAIAMALFDLWRAGDELSEGSWTGFVAYGVSSALGFYIAFLLFSSSGVGLVVWVVVAIGWAFVMTVLVDDDLQDWMERCVWGKLSADRYNDFNTEVIELEKATGLQLRQSAGAQ